MAALDSPGIGSGHAESHQGDGAHAPSEPVPEARSTPSSASPPDAEYPLEYQFLDDSAVAPYLESLRHFPPTNSRPQSGSGSLADAVDRKAPFPVAFTPGNRNWTAATYPLILCEFLAYKSGLAYRSPREIYRDLMGIGSDGSPYNQGITQYAFFDTAHPSATVRFGDTQAFAFIHQRTGYVIFRGTSTIADVKTDLHDELTDTSYDRLGPVPQTLVGKAWPARHTGFAIAWGSIAPDVEAWTSDQLRAGHMDKIVFSGHSLGGALAMLAGHDFAIKRICPVHAVITFGAPMVGGKEFKASYEQAALGIHDRTLRVEAAEDLVAVLTKRANDYDHVGHQWRFKQRPLRPTWQMILFSPLVDAEQTATRKIERIEKQGSRPGKAGTSAHPSNAGKSRPARTWRQFVIGIVVQLLWYLARFIMRAVAAHSVEQRYGLFISTLSYQKIRAYRVGEAQRTLQLRRGQGVERIMIEEAYRAAGDDLTRHLAVVRGRHPRTFRHLARRPIRVSTPTELAHYQKRYQNYIV